MLGTLFAVITAIFFAFHIYETPTIFAPVASPFFLVSSLFLLIVAFLGSFYAWQAILRTQQKIISCAQELYLSDGSLFLSIGYLFALLLYSLYMTLEGPSSSNIAASVMVYIWFIAFGGGFDLLRYVLKRSYQYSYVPFLMQKVTHEVQKAVQEKEEPKALEWVEISIEATARATHKGRIGLASSSLASLQTLIETYVKEVAHAQAIQPFQQETGVPTFTDKVSFLCIFVSERLEWVFEIALREHMRPIADDVIGEFGKMSVFFARHNTNVASLPLSFLMKCGQMAQKRGETEVVTRAALTLSETCKSLISYAKERNESIRDLIMTTLFTLEQLVKMMFKESKEINPVLLMQPFAEVGEFIGQEVMRTFPDRDEVLKEIRRILSEFQALQIVTKNIETMTPAVSEDTTSTYQQDLPYTP